MAAALLKHAGQPTTSLPGAILNGLAAGIGGYFEGADERQAATTAADAARMMTPAPAGGPPASPLPSAPPPMASNPVLTPELLQAHAAAFPPNGAPPPTPSFDAAASQGAPGKGDKLPVAGAPSFADRLAVPPAPKATAYAPEDDQSASSIGRMIAEAAQRYNVPVAELMAIKRNETGAGNGIGAVSKAGAIGPMQLMPATARELGVDPNDTAQNIDGGARYYAQQREKFSNPTLAAAAYNAGPGRVASGGPLPAETTNYMRKFDAQLQPGTAMAFNGAPQPQAGFPAQPPAPATADAFNPQTYAPSQPPVRPLTPADRPQLAPVNQPQAPQSATGQVGGYTPQVLQQLDDWAKNGNPAQRATAAKLLEQYSSQRANPQWQLKQFGTDMLGQPNLLWVNDATGETKSLAERNGAPPNAPGMVSNGMLAKGVTQLDSEKQGTAYLAQFSPEVQAAVRAYMRGDVMPTGNPRQQGIASLAKTIAQKYGQDTGQEVNDTTYANKRKMQNELAGSEPNTLGGLLDNGRSAIGHLAHLSQNLADIGNSSGPNVRGGTHLGEMGNYFGNVLFPTAGTKNKIGEALETAKKYGEESTKFYVGSGGTEGERGSAGSAVNPNYKTGAEQAGYMQAERDLMVRRLQEKERQIARDLGPDILARKPVFTPEVKADIATIDRNIAALRGGAEAAPNAPSQPSGEIRYLNGKAYRRGPNGEAIPVQ